MFRFSEWLQLECVPLRTRIFRTIEMSFAAGLAICLGLCFAGAALALLNGQYQPEIGYEIAVVLSLALAADRVNSWCANLQQRCNYELDKGDSRGCIVLCSACAEKCDTAADESQIPTPSPASIAQLLTQAAAERETLGAADHDARKAARQRSKERREKERREQEERHSPKSPEAPAELLDDQAAAELPPPAPFVDIPAAPPSAYSFPTFASFDDRAA